MDRGGRRGKLWAVPAAVAPSSAWSLAAALAAAVLGPAAGGPVRTVAPAAWTGAAGRAQRDGRHEAAPANARGRVRKPPANTASGGRTGAPPGEAGAAAGTDAARPSETEPTAGTDAARPSETEPAGSVGAASYGRAEAERDLDVVLGGAGLDLVRARARLRAAPGPAIEAVEARLATDLPPAGRQRLLAVLADLAGAGAASPLARHYAARIRRATGARQLDEALSVRAALARLGEARLPVAVDLARDATLPSEVRAPFVAELAAALPAARAGELVPHLGAADPILRGALRRATITRLRTDRQFRSTWTNAARAVLRGGDEGTRAQVFLVFAALPDPPPELGPDALGAARSADAPFAVRLAAVTFLRHHGTAAERRALAPLAAAGGPATRPTREAEILARAALSALSDEDAARVVQAADLYDAADPALAALAHRRRPPPAATALATGTTHPWPAVRAAALAALSAPCPPAASRTLARLVRPPWRGGDPADRVARAALRALGRCGDRRARRAVLSVLRDAAAPAPRRIDAARVALARFGPAGLDAVLTTLARTDHPAVAADLVATLAHADPTAPGVREALCSARRTPGPIAASARRTMAALGLPPTTCPTR